MFLKVTFSRFFYNIARFNVGPARGTAHIQTIFHLLPCLGQHDWVHGSHANEYPLLEIVHILDFLSIHEAYKMTFEGKVQGALWRPRSGPLPSNPPVVESGTKCFSHT